MSLDLEVRGDPDGCRAAAHRLMTVAATTQSTGDALARAAATSEADFGGLCGTTFRTHARSLATCADDAAQRCRRVSGALSELALDLEDVRRLMARARRTAEPWLVVAESRIWPPGTTDDALPEAAQAAWLVASELVAVARQLEARAQLDWRNCLLQVAEGHPLVYQPQLGPHLTPDDHRPGTDDADPDRHHAAHPAPDRSTGDEDAAHHATVPAPAEASPPSTGSASASGAASTSTSPSPVTWGVGHLPAAGIGHLDGPAPDPTPPDPTPPDPTPNACGTPTLGADADEPR